MIDIDISLDTERERGTEKLYALNTVLQKVRKSFSYTQKALQTASQLRCNLHLGRKISSLHGREGSPLLS